MNSEPEARLTAPRLASPMEKTFFDRGGLWIVGQSVLLVTVACIGIYYREQFAPFRFQLAIASVLFVLSAFTGIAGTITLGKNRTAFPEPLPHGHFVSTGIYGIIRHPLYLSLMLWAFSWALFWCSAVGLLSAVVVAIFFDAKARHEERLLQKGHRQYADYQRRVRRFLPGVY